MLDVRSSHDQDVVHRWCDLDGVDGVVVDVDRERRDDSAERAVVLVPWTITGLESRMSLPFSLGIGGSLQGTRTFTRSAPSTVNVT